MKPWIPLALVLAAACGNETELGQIDAKIEASPRLTDFGDVPVGATAILTVQIDHLQGLAVQVTNVALTNIDGAYFTYEGPTALTVEQGASATLEIAYTPQTEGWHRATVEIVHNAEGQRIPLEVRGHGVVPEADLSPLAVDFGPVPVPTVAVRSVAVTNRSTVALAIDDATFPNGVFSLGAPLPIDVPAGATVDVPVQFTPASDLPALGAMTLQFAGIALPTVSLRGNDCEGGDAAAYDVDRDGFSICGGDCDDARAEVSPAGVETWDGVDEDCDGVVDEGTAGFDDDGDGYCEDPTACVGVAEPGDCNDGEPGVRPDALEIFDNGIDDDCDGVVDYGTADADLDGYSVAGGDCDDTDPDRSPADAEILNGTDDDCDGQTDEGTPATDDDADGFCEAGCIDGSAPGDCDDASAATNPAAGELADWRDNDCDGQVDEGTVQHDDDGDGYTEVGGDCDDADAALNPAFGNC
jgi:hypothetical protein